MSIIKKFLYNCLLLQEKFLKARLKRTINAKNLSKRKLRFSEGCYIDFNSLADTEKQKLEDDMLAVLKKYNFDPDLILKYIESQNTQVIWLNNASKLLAGIGENEGFILPEQGFKALAISLLTKKQFSLKTNAMFVLSKGEINRYYFIYHFYNWFAFKHNIEGMDSKSQKLLKKYLFTNADTKELHLDDIFKLKDAIKQDKASIDFVIKLCRNIDGQKQALNKIHNEGSAKL